jgi:predicted phosphoserine aminotransferase
MPRMFVPGPVDVADEVLAAQTKPMIPHRSKDFEAIFRRCDEKLRQVFFTERPVYISTSSGSGLQEAGIRNFTNETVLSCVNGAFAKRWYDVAIANNKQADKLEVAWGEVIKPDQLAEALKQKHYEVVTIVHNETSTGAENPVKELAKVVHETSPDTLILVDAVSSLGGTKIECDAWGLDFLLTSSQKCFALPPGIAFGAASERAMKKAETVKFRGWYFDLLLLEKHRQKDSTPMTPAMSLIWALDVQLDRMLAEGLENRFKRHAAMAKRTQDWAATKGMLPLAPEGYRSKTVSTINNTRNMDIAALNEFLKPKGLRIANGYGDLKGKTYRIAHMGEINMNDVDKLLAAMDEFLNQM